MIDKVKSNTNYNSILLYERMDARGLQALCFEGARLLTDHLIMAYEDDRSGLLREFYRELEVITEENSRLLKSNLQRKDIIKKIASKYRKLREQVVEFCGREQGVEMEVGRGMEEREVTLHSSRRGDASVPLSASATQSSGKASEKSACVRIPVVTIADSDDEDGAGRGGDRGEIRTVIRPAQQHESRVDLSTTNIVPKVGGDGARGRWDLKRSHTVGAVYSTDSSLRSGTGAGGGGKSCAFDEDLLPPWKRRGVDIENQEIANRNIISNSSSSSISGPGEGVGVGIGAGAGVGIGTRPIAKSIDVVRARDLRDSLPGHMCQECKKFYETAVAQGMIQEGELMECLKSCSRHKAAYSPAQTPEGAWDLSIQTPAEWKS